MTYTPNLVNNSSANIRLDWNEFACSWAICNDTGKAVDLGQIREGTQYYQGGIKSVTTVANCCVRTDCDLRDAQIVFSDV